MFVVLLVCVGAMVTASAEPKGTYVMAPEPAESPVSANGSVLIYLNRHGGFFSRGSENPFSNSSWIVRNPGTISAFPGSDDEWLEVLDCVRYLYSPFNVDITDQDPGNAAHIEAVVGGHPNEIGLDSDIGGVANLHCGGASTGLNFNFTHSGIGESVCVTIAQETGHSLGLDHLMTCNDPMTYLPSCGFKTFQNTNANCGENTARFCSCGGTTQNSYTYFENLLGGSQDNASPQLDIRSPAPNGNVPVGFKVRARATDDVAVENIEFYLDGEFLGEDRFGVVEVQTPFTLGLGKHELEVIATDVAGKSVSEKRSFTLTTDGNPPECYEDNECSTGEICWQLKCFADSGLASTGEACAASSDCLTSNCKTVDDKSLCTQGCDKFTPCPDGYACQDEDSSGYCWPASSGGGCHSMVGGLTLVTMAFLMLGILSRRRESVA